MSAAGTLIHTATFAGIFALLALGLNIKFGFSGLLDFGHVAFFLVGAYTATLLVIEPAEAKQFQEYILGLNLPVRIAELTGVEALGVLGWGVAFAAAITVAGFLGLLVALPAIRLREDYLAIALLGISVILVRIVQTETWLANGPDSLRGYPDPLREFFPLPGESMLATTQVLEAVTMAFLLGLTVFAVWAILAYFAGLTDAIGSREGPTGWLVHGLLAVTTLGVGYWAARRTRATFDERAVVGGQIRLRDYAPLFGAAAVIGVVATIGSLLGLGELAILVTLGAASLGMWLVAGLAVRDHYREYGPREIVLALGFALAAYLTMAPAVLFGQAGDELLVTVAVSATFLAIALLCVGVYLLYVRWDRLPFEENFLGVIGLATVWLLAIRYFLVSLRGSRSVGDMVGSTIQNFLWLVDLDLVAGAVGLDYSRFFLLVVAASVGFVYLLLETTVKSPFGRVLKSIREDEDVALALGKNTFAFKVQGMMLGSAIAGLAGAYWAIKLGALSFNTFHPIVTFFVFLIVILGGTANNKGVILGAGLYWIFVQATVELAAQFPAGISARLTVLRNAIIGLMLMVILYYRPEGIWPEERMIAEVSSE